MTARYKNVFVIWLLSLIFLVVSGVAQDWLGFHGLERQGVAPEAARHVDWSGPIQTNWHTPIQGFGYSSPVVMQDGIYLTTAYETQKGKSLRDGLAYLNQALSLGACRHCRHPCDWGNYRQRLWPMGQSAQWLSQLFHHERGTADPWHLCVWRGVLSSGIFDVRSWKIGTAAAFISVSLILLLMPRSKLGSFAFAVLATSLSVVAYVFFPLQDIFLDSRISGAIICTSVILLPALLGWAACVSLRGPRPQPASLAAARIRACADFPLLWTGSFVCGRGFLGLEVADGTGPPAHAMEWQGA